jgi:hypothetical protein
MAHVPLHINVGYPLVERPLPMAVPEVVEPDARDLGPITRRIPHLPEPVTTQGDRNRPVNPGVELRIHG